MFNEAFQLGTLNVPNRVLLSPLAGVSDVPFRRICQDLGAGLSYIEMLSAAGMPYENRKTPELLARDEHEPMLGAQMTGANPDVMSLGARILMDKDLEVDTLDINMGCPVKKIVGKGCGSAIVKHPELAGEIANATREAVDVPVTAKIRIGYFRKQVTVEAVCAELAKAGMKMITIHGRFREDSYSDPVQLEWIRAGFEAAEAHSAGEKIWKIGNGNIFDLASARRMQEETGCDGVLISRGALGNPWLFRQILEEDPRQPSLGEWRDVLLRHLQYHGEFYDREPYAAVRFRKHLLWYLSGFRGCRAMRGKLNTVNSLQEAREAILRYCEELPEDLPRFADQADKKSQDYDPKFEMDRQHDRGVEYYEE